VLKSSNKKKAIIFDIDGTAMPIGDGHMPSVRLREAIQALTETYHIGTATGRSLMYAKDIIEFLGMKDDCIIAAGTEIYNPTQQEIVWREAIPLSSYQHIIDTLSRYSNQIFSGEIDEEGLRADKDTVRLLDGQTAVLYVIAMKQEDADRLAKELQHKDLHVINMHSFWGSHLRDIHIHSVKASKEHAVSELLQKYGLVQQDSIVIGDGLNDLHLFAAGGTKVAMGNAVDELKQHADIVIDPIEVDGLAGYFEELAKLR
jgi:Cof subfamily protein (haloacid dehalogenase superfamily)